MSYPLDAFLWRCPIKLWVQVTSALLARFFLFDSDTLRVCPGILPNACHLPGNFHTGRTARNFEVIGSDFFCNIKIWSIHAQLV